MYELLSFKTTSTSWEKRLIIFSFFDIKQLISTSGGHFVSTSQDRTGYWYSIHYYPKNLIKLKTQLSNSGNKMSAENSGKSRENVSYPAFHTHNHYHVHRDEHLSNFQRSPTWSMSSGDSLKVNSGSPNHELLDVDVELTRVKRAKRRACKSHSKLRKFTNKKEKKVKIEAVMKEDLTEKLQLYGKLKYQMKKNIYLIKKREDQLQNQIWANRDDDKEK